MDLRLVREVILITRRGIHSFSSGSDRLLPLAGPVLGRPNPRLFVVFGVLEVDFLSRVVGRVEF